MKSDEHVQREAGTVESAGFESRQGPRQPPKILILGPSREIVGGVSTHLNQLFNSVLDEDFALAHLNAGSVQFAETKRQTVTRLLIDYVHFVVALVRDRPDIVHVNVTLDRKSFPRDSLFLAMARALGIPVVFQVHGGDMPDDLYRGRNLLTRLVHGVLRAASVVVLLGRTQLASFSKSVPSARYRVIPNAIEIDAASEPPARYESGPLRLVFVGRLAAVKGVADCIQAARLLKESGRDFTFKIAGSGSEEPRLRELTRSLDLDENVEFLGPIFGDDLKALWRASDVFVFPSYNLEGLPYALLESMEAGVVPITTRMGAQPEVMEDGVHGLFIPAKDPEALYDAIVRLYDDRAALSRMSRAAMKRVRENYTVDRLVRDFRSLYDSVLT